MKPYACAFWVAVSLLFLGTLPITNARERGFTVSREGERYSLDAHEAPLDEVLRALNQQAGGKLEFFGTPSRKVSSRYTRLPLDEVLTRLGVSYVLTYARGDGSAYALDHGMLLGQGPPGLRHPALTVDEQVRLRKAVNDLRDDDIPFNALAALSTLYGEGCRAVPLLEEALWSDDYQMRQAAAQVLRYGCPDYRPSPRMLEVTLELLKADLPGASEVRDLAHVNSAFGFLRDATNLHAQLKPRLVQNLASADRQERFLSAVLLAEQGASEYAASLFPVLVPHLADNDLRSDAQLAAHALYQLGPSIASRIRGYADSPDPQQAELATLILHQLDHPEDTSAVVSDFMFCSYNRNPLLQRPDLRGALGPSEQFPDANGRYTEEVAGGFVPGRGDPWTPAPPPVDVPAPSSPETEWISYTVLPGDTAREICKLFIISLEELGKANGLDLAPETNLVPGTALLIPMPAW